MAELTWHPEAVTDLETIYAYISRDSPAVAQAFVERVVAAIERLRDFPRSGRIVPETRNDVIREVLVGPYRVVYRIVDQDIQIVMVRHGAQLLREVREPDIR